MLMVYSAKAVFERSKPSTRATSRVSHSPLPDPMFAVVESIHARKKFFANNLAVLHSVNADFGHFPALVGFLVRNVSVVLNDESIVTDERTLGIEAVDFHRVHPPIYLAAHAFFASSFGRPAAHAVGFHAHNV